jgi:hypothetical protein
VLLLGAASAGEHDLSARIAQARAAEQQLQGPLDGHWIVRTDRGRPVLALQLIDPPDGRGPVGGAWRDLDGTLGSGIVGVTRRGAHDVVLVLMKDGSEMMRLRLEPAAGGRWRGWMWRAGRWSRVSISSR